MRLRSVVTATVALSLLLMGQVMAAGPASAHTALVATAPADGTDLTEPPAHVTLEFSGDLNAGLSQVVVTGPDGDLRQDGEPTVDGATVTQPLRPLETSGVYEVAWRVVAGDGHPISGTFQFTSAGIPVPGEPAGAAGSGGQTQAPRTGTDAPATDNLVGTVNPVAAGAQAATPDGGSGFDGVALASGAALAAAALALTALVLSRRRRRAGATDDE